MFTFLVNTYIHLFFWYLGIIFEWDSSVVAGASGLQGHQPSQILGKPYLPWLLTLDYFNICPNKYFIRYQKITKMSKLRSFKSLKSRVIMRLQHRRSARADLLIGDEVALVSPKSLSFFCGRYSTTCFSTFHNENRYVESLSSVKLAARCMIIKMREGFTR